jgi:hypothetical protein
MMLWFALLLLAMGDETAALAPPAPVPVPDAAPSAAPASPDPNRVICFKEAQAGTLFTRKICHTREEWKKLQDAERRKADRMLDTGDSNRTTRE